MNYIDLFAGAGGLSEGFIQAGFTPIAHVEMDRAACNTLKTRVAFHYLKEINQLDVYYSYLKGEIKRDELYKQIPEHLMRSVINLSIGPENNEKIFDLISKQLGDKEVDLIIGGPPCQAYSLVGRARSADGMKNDPRNHLYIQYATFLEKYNPKFFIFENVLGLKSADGGEYLRKMEDIFREKGYQIKLYELAANNFGVLQKRKRVIILGYKMSINIDLPDFEGIQLEHNFTVESIFNDLPPIQAGESHVNSNYYSNCNEYLSKYQIRSKSDILTQHIARPQSDQDKKIYRLVVNQWEKHQQRIDYNELPENLKTHKNRHSFFDRFKIVASDLKYSQTVVAHIAKDGHYYIHPDVKQNRSISVREAARLQSFPDNYFFEGVKERQYRTAAFKQIGNAVPTLMAKEIAKNVHFLISSK
jgi:DNA (cytosine-5)-methyltransferase 1